MAILRFANAGLESMYQAHRDAASSNTWALFCAAHFLTGACLTLHRMATATKAQLDLLPISWLVAALGVFLSS